jgi:hypothetical protein
MKILQKTEEKAIDKLLRAQAVQLNATGAACEGFDADFANAYVERLLSPAQEKLYESHMAACTSCRKLTVSMMRAYQADLSPAQLVKAASVEKSSSGWITSLRSLIPAFVTPRFALAATAIIAVAIALPLFFLKQNQAPGNTSSIAQYDAGSSAPAASPTAPVPAVVGQSAANEVQHRNELASGAGAATPQEDKAKEAAKTMDGLLALEAKKDPAGEPTASAPPAPTAEDDSTRKEAEAAATTKSEEPARSEERAQPRASESAQGGADRSAERPLPKIDRDGARSLPDGDRGSQPTVTPLAPGRSGVELPAAKDKPVIRPGDSSPRSESRADSVGRSRIAEGPSTSAKRESSEEAKTRSRSTRETKSTQETKVGGKKFFLRDGIWTQEDYQKDKEMPLVPVEQGSELYNQLMAKHSKLKLYFTGFADQSAIIVYKGTVYKLTPKK